MDYFFSLGIIDAPKTVKIPNINPTIGTPVCCIGIAVVAAFNVVGFAFCVVFIGFTFGSDIGFTGALLIVIFVFNVCSSTLVDMLEVP